MLLAFKHMNLIPDSDAFLCILLHLLSFCPPVGFFNKPSCPISLNTLHYPSHWQSLLTVPRQKRQPLSIKIRPSLKYISSFPHRFPTNLRIPLPLPYTAASPSRWLPSSSNLCILGSWFQTLVKSMIRYSAQPSLPSSSSVDSCISSLSLLFLLCLCYSFLCEPACCMLVDHTWARRRLLSRASSVVWCMLVDHTWARGRLLCAGWPYSNQTSPVACCMLVDHTWVRRRLLSVGWSNLTETSHVVCWLIILEPDVACCTLVDRTWIKRCLLYIGWPYLSQSSPVVGAHVEPCWKQRAVSACRMLLNGHTLRSPRGWSMVLSEYYVCKPTSYLMQHNCPVVQTKHIAMSA